MLYMESEPEMLIFTTIFFIYLFENTFSSAGVNEIKLAFGLKRHIQIETLYSEHLY